MLGFVGFLIAWKQRMSLRCVFFQHERQISFAFHPLHARPCRLTSTPFSRSLGDVTYLPAPLVLDIISERDAAVDEYKRREQASCCPFLCPPNECCFMYLSARFARKCFGGRI